MKINFTKKEYAALVEMILTADWVIHARETEPTDETQPYADLRKKVLSYHKEMGMEEAFRYAAEDNEYYETADYEMSSPHMALIDQLSEISFWETLATKLAQRDLAAQEAIGTAEPLPPEQRVTKLWEIEERCQEELSENGLANIRIDTKAGGTE
jgi:hypothetical protein